MTDGARVLPDDEPYAIFSGDQPVLIERSSDDAAADQLELDVGVAIRASCLTQNPRGRVNRHAAELWHEPETGLTASG